MSNYDNTLHVKLYIMKDIIYIITYIIKKILMGINEVNLNLVKNKKSTAPAQLT